jgi:hypothetical protein
MLGTVKAIEDDLLHDGLLVRYRTQSGVDGLSGTENPFLTCSFWLAEQYARSGRITDATELMDRLVAFRNDVGMLSEEIEVATGHHVGNTPQALSHLALVRAADAIDAALDHSRGNRGRRLASAVGPKHGTEPYGGGLDGAEPHGAEPHGASGASTGTRLGAERDRYPDDLGADRTTSA